MFSKRPGSGTATSATLVGRPVSNSIRPPAITRQQHIDSYRNNPQLAPSTRKVSDDDSTFDTIFQSVAGDTLILRVHWPAVTFPTMAARPPIMTLAGVEARHPWLDERTMRVTGYTPIATAAQWTEANILLGAAVHAVIYHLQLNPPTIVKFVDAGLVAIQKQYSATSSSQGQPGNRPNTTLSSSNAGAYPSTTPPAYHDAMGPTRPTPPALPDVKLPVIPYEFAELDNLTRDQMEAMMADELEFRAFSSRLPIMDEYKRIQLSVLAENASTAQKNLESEAELLELVTSVQRLQTELREKVNAFQVLERQQDAICQPPTAVQVCRELQRLKKQAFDESERIAEQWLDTISSTNGSGSQPVTSTTDAFCEEFIAARMIHHIRAAKLELLERSST